VAHRGGLCFRGAVTGAEGLALDAMFGPAEPLEP